MSLRLEALEERAVPSGGHGPSGSLGGPGSPSGSSGGPGPSALVGNSNPGPSVVAPVQQGSTSGSSGQGPGGAFTGTIRVGAPLPTPGPFGIRLDQLFASGYPLPPSMGPSLQNNLLVLSNPTAWPFSAQQSTVVVIPVMLAGVTVAPVPGSTAQSVTLTYMNMSDGSMFTVQATAINPSAPPPAQPTMPPPTTVTPTPPSSMPQPPTAPTVGTTGPTTPPRTSSPTVTQ